jgi:hypothetical protein
MGKWVNENETKLLPLIHMDDTAQDKLHQRPRNPNK